MDCRLPSGAHGTNGVKLPEQQRFDMKKKTSTVFRLGFGQLLLCHTKLVFLASRGGLCHLALWHLPGGPVGSPARWATTSNVVVGKTTYRVKRDGGGEGATNKVRKRREGSGVGRVPGHLAREGGLNLDICTGAVRVPSYATADWAVWSVYL